MPLDLLVGMTLPADERGPDLILRLGFEFASVRSGGKIGMTTGTGQGIMHGGLKFIGVYIGDQRFIVLKEFDDARFGMAVQASSGFIGKRDRIRSGLPAAASERRAGPPPTGFPVFPSYRHLPAIRGCATWRLMSVLCICGSLWLCSIRSTETSPSRRTSPGFI